MIRGRDPNTMAPDEQVRAIATLLATGYRRLLLSRKKVLDDRGPDEPSCEQAVYTFENQHQAKREQAEEAA